MRKAMREFCSTSNTLTFSSLPEGRRVFPYMSVRDNLMMGAFSRSDAAGVRTSFEYIREVGASCRHVPSESCGRKNG
jgi:branched-chain amino acid transport system ATP-binding protein